jgi:NADPH-dependent 2,4-dienoyl-CoA reductase/sulfur reductase-like enzyme
MRFVIVGGDAAGMSAASLAKRKMPEAEVTVLEQGYDVSYSACGMPYAIADPQRSMQELVVREARVFREKQGVDVELGCRVEGIDPDKGRVYGTSLEGGPFERSYDKLLLATGASAVRPDLPGFDLPGVEVLKSLEHGRRIKDYLARNRVRRAILLGMGYISLEMAESLRRLGIEVAMVKPGSELLPWMDRSLAELVRAELEANGVELYPGRAIHRLEKQGDGLRLICDHGELSADFVLAGIGVRPNSELAAHAGLDLGPKGAVAVDRAMRTGHSEIYAAGDCADAYHVVTGEKTWIPLALRANRSGRAAGENACGGNVRLDGVAGTTVFRVLDLEVATTGINADQAREHGYDPAAVSIETRSRAHGHPGARTIRVALVGDRRSGRLLGAQMVGGEGVAHRVNAAAVALHAGMDVEAFSQTDLAYAPPFGPVWDPLLTAARELLKKLEP